MKKWSRGQRVPPSPLSLMEYRQQQAPPQWLHKLLPHLGSLRVETGVTSRPFPEENSATISLACWTSTIGWVKRPPWTISFLWNHTHRAIPTNNQSSSSSHNWNISSTTLRKVGPVSELLWNLLIFSLHTSLAEEQLHKMWKHVSSLRAQIGHKASVVTFLR